MVATIWDAAHLPVPHVEVAERFHLLWIRDGASEVTVDGTTHRLTVGMGCMIAPSQYYMIRLTDSTSRIGEIAFLPNETLPVSLHEAFVVPYVETLYPTYVYKAHVKQDRVALQAVEKAWRRLVNQDALSEYDATLQLAVVWRHWIQRVEEPITRSKSQTRFIELLRLVHVDRQTRLSLDELAKRHGMSKSECCRLFMRHLGTTPSQYIQAVRMQDVAKTLQTTEMSIAEAARQYGYSSVSHFVQAFKKIHTLTPLAYRRAIKQKEPT